MPKIILAQYLICPSTIQELHLPGLSHVVIASSSLTHRDCLIFSLQCPAYILLDYWLELY